jgi:hypothetical protein
MTWPANCTLTPEARAQDCASTDGWWSRASRCCTASAGYASAGRYATTSMKPSSSSDARYRRRLKSSPSGSKSLVLARVATYLATVTRRCPASVASAPPPGLFSRGYLPATGQGYASGALQTSQNLGQTVVLALASALFSAVSTEAPGQLVPFVWAFALLILPVAGPVCLAGRTRTASPDRQRDPEPAVTAAHAEPMDET